MAFTGSYIPTSLIADLWSARINAGSDTFRMALYTSAATLDASTTAYTTSGELATALGYTAGGVVITISITTQGTANGPTTIIDFSDASWTTPTFTARGAMIYDDTAAGDPAIMILDFGTDKTGDGVNNFVVTMPTANANNGLITFPAASLPTV